jgi:hypothetical protein
LRFLRRVHVLIQVLLNALIHHVLLAHNVREGLNARLVDVVILLRERIQPGINLFYLPVILNGEGRLHHVVINRVVWLGVRLLVETVFVEAPKIILVLLARRHHALVIGLLRHMVLLCHLFLVEEVLGKVLRSHVDGIGPRHLFAPTASKVIKISNLPSDAVGHRLLRVLDIAQDLILQLRAHALLVGIHLGVHTHIAIVPLFHLRLVLGVRGKLETQALGAPDMLIEVIVEVIRSS